MTIEEKREAIKKFCEEHSCSNCVLYTSIPKDEACWDDGADFERNYRIICSDTEEDVVNHPKHYCREGAMESIDEMVLIFGVEAVKAFCLCNAWKYRYRAADKNGAEDLKKSDWYIRKYKELCGEQP